MVALAALPVSGQGYAKMNALYGAAGVINPSVELRISPHSTVQAEGVLSLWNSVKDPQSGIDKPMRFGIMMTEYRRYFRAAFEGWYVGANCAMMGFKMSKPYIEGWQVRLQDRYCKGYGMMYGVAAGWEHRFGSRWLVDIYGGWAYMLSWYNGYSLDGQIDLYPQRPVAPDYPDPMNGSAEWLPNKIGISIGVLLF